MFIGFRPHVGPQGRSKTPKDETLSQGKSETPKDVWLSQLRQEIRTAVKDQTSLSHSNPIAEAVKAKRTPLDEKRKKLDGIQKKLDEIKEKSIALKPQKTPQPSEIEKDWSSCVELRREIQVTIKELIDNNPEIFRPNNDVSIDIPFSFLDQNHLGEAQIYHNSLTAMLQQLKEKFSAQREDLENKFDKHYRTLSKTAKETVKSDAYKNDFLGRELTQVIDAHPRVSEKFIRQEFGRAFMEQRNQAIVEEMAKKYDETLQESKTTSSGSLGSASSVITFSTSSPSVSTISSDSSLSSPDHQTTTSQPIQESPKQPEPKRSWLRSCLDSVVSLFQRKPKKTDVKEVFSSEAGRKFLSQLHTVISDASAPLRDTMPPTEKSETDKRYDKKLFSDFAQRLPHLIEEEEKSNPTFRFTGLKTEFKEIREQKIVRNTAFLFKEFYYRKIVRHRDEFEADLQKLNADLDKLKANLQKSNADLQELYPDSKKLNDDLQKLEEEIPKEELTKFISAKEIIKEQKLTKARLTLIKAQIFNLERLVKSYKHMEDKAKAVSSKIENASYDSETNSLVIK